MMALFCSLNRRALSTQCVAGVIARILSVPLRAQLLFYFMEFIEAPIQNKKILAGAVQFVIRTQVNKWHNKLHRLLPSAIYIIVHNKLQRQLS
jgi:hypothetical protein